MVQPGEIVNIYNAAHQTQCITSITRTSYNCVRTMYTVT